MGGLAKIFSNFSKKKKDFFVDSRKKQFHVRIKKLMFYHSHTSESNRISIDLNSTIPNTKTTKTNAGKKL